MDSGSAWEVICRQASVYWDLCRDNGKENGNYRDCIGII